ncbi:hypothetical protein AWB69_08646 [Caballeronia udeis]|uniref:Uncharacterized protein n=1 Tax=Caballeronia udeis TaxID=1232866 RepID=A0A158JRI0_9BURK|nr:hypothetical protein AWB69_08646 [Caballeronia udeis]
MHQRNRGNRHTESLAGSHYFCFEFIRVSPPFAAPRGCILVNSVHVSAYSLSGHDAPKAAASIQDAITGRLRPIAAVSASLCARRVAASHESQGDPRLDIDCSTGIIDHRKRSSGRYGSRLSRHRNNGLRWLRPSFLDGDSSPLVRPNSPGFGSVPCHRICARRNQASSIARLKRVVRMAVSEAIQRPLWVACCRSR